MYINKRAMLSNVYDICTVVAHLRVSHAQEQSVRIHHLDNVIKCEVPEMLGQLKECHRLY